MLDFEPDKGSNAPKESKNSYEKENLALDLANQKKIGLGIVTGKSSQNYFKNGINSEFGENTDGDNNYLITKF
jgi:hypothetical protein